MEVINAEYLVLFNAVTCSIEKLEELKKQLMEAQQKAEELYIDRTA